MGGIRRGMVPGRGVRLTAASLRELATSLSLDAEGVEIEGDQQAVLTLVQALELVKRAVEREVVPGPTVGRHPVEDVPRVAPHRAVVDVPDPVHVTSPGPCRSR